VTGLVSGILSALMEKTGILNKWIASNSKHLTHQSGSRLSTTDLGSDRIGEWNIIGSNGKNRYTKQVDST